MEASGTVTILLARFEDLVAAGLRCLIDEDAHLQIVATDVDVDSLDREIAEHGPRVAILNLGSLRAPAEIRRLSAAYPQTRLIVLANHPTPGQCAQLLALGATACLGKEVEGRDV